MSTPMTTEAKVAAAAGQQNVRSNQSTAATNAKVAQAAAQAGVRPPPARKK